MHFSITLSSHFLKPIIYVRWGGSIGVFTSSQYSSLHQLPFKFVGNRADEIAITCIFLHPSSIDYFNRIKNINKQIRKGTSVCYPD